MLFKRKAKKSRPIHPGTRRAVAPFRSPRVNGVCSPMAIEPNRRSPDLHQGGRILVTDDREHSHGFAGRLETAYASAGAR
jgi:hypothetical protein